MTGLTVVLCVLMGLGVVGSVIWQARVSSVRPGEQRELEFYEVAYLAGGRTRVAEVALAYLVWAGLVEIRVGSGVLALVAAPGSGVELRPVESALMSTIPADGRKATVPLAAAREAAGWVEARLGGLLVPARDRLLIRAPAIGAALLASVWAVGVGMSVANGWGSLALVPLIAVVVIAVAMLGKNRLTKTGKEVLAAEQRRHVDDESIAKLGVTSLPIETGLYIVAMYGRAAMTGSLAPLRRVIR